MSLIVSWVLFPLVLAALGLGWGALVEWASRRAHAAGALDDPARARRGDRRRGAAHRVLFERARGGAGGGGRRPSRVSRARGGARGSRRRRSSPAVGVLLVYGAPVILSGQATFLGYVRLDDTATWLAFIDQFFAPRPLAPGARPTRPSSCCCAPT